MDCENIEKEEDEDDCYVMMIVMVTAVKCKWRIFAIGSLFSESSQRRVKNVKLALMEMYVVLIIAILE